MLAIDWNSNPLQYRSWITANNPDLTAQYYYGYKSGNNPLVDISAYVAPNDLINYSLPLAADWLPAPSELIKDFPINVNLPSTLEDASLAIISDSNDGYTNGTSDGYFDGYIYAFGGRLTAHIYRATLNNPANWIDTGITLPSALYGASLAIVNNTIYLFGGNDGYTANSIFSAPVSNPLHWTNTGATLPIDLQYSHLGMYNGSLYLFGGQTSGGVATNAILTASAAHPTVWTNTGQTLPSAVYGGCIAQIGGNWMLFGGNTGLTTITNAIQSAPITNPTSWSITGSLPYATSFSQFITVGNDGYIIGPMVGQTPFTGFTPIVQAHLNTPTTWFDTQKYVSGQISHSNIAMIYDRVWLFGGSGSTTIFACNQLYKYVYADNSNVQNYSQITRVIFPATDNLDDPYSALCYPYWRSDYSMSVPITPPAVPPPPVKQILFPPTVPRPPYI